MGKFKTSMSIGELRDRNEATKAAQAAKNPPPPPPKKG